MWVLRGERAQEGTVWRQAYLWKLGAGVVGRADPVFVIEGLLVRWTFTEPLLCVRLWLQHCERPDERG